MFMIVQMLEKRMSLETVECLALQEIKSTKNSFQGVDKFL